MLAACTPFAGQAHDWLNANTTSAPPEIDISGSWTSSDWGDSYFHQEGGKVSGMLGGYPVRGVVNRSSAYLIVYSRLPAYTVVLWLEGRDVLGGRWARREVVDARHGEPLILRRTGN